MSQFDELKRLAEAVRDSDIDWEPNQKSYDYFQALRDPRVVLALIAENDLLRGAHEQICTSYNQVSYASEERGKQIDQLKAELEHTGYDHDLLRNENDQLKAENEIFEDGMRSLASTLGAGGYNATTLTAAQLVEKVQWGVNHFADTSGHMVDQLRAEVAGLKTDYEAYERVNAELKAECEALRKDKDRLDALESNFWDVRHDSHPIADTGDSSSSLEIVGHWMDKPFERVIGEDWNENLRAAIDQAMKAPAYPPARPEYPEIDDIPDFTPGNGNSARRRAASLGIDYDAAMGKGEQP